MHKFKVYCLKAITISRRSAVYMRRRIIAIVKPFKLIIGKFWNDLLMSVGELYYFNPPKTWW